MKVNRRLRNVKGADMKIFQTPSYDRFCLFEMERKSKDFRGMDGNAAYKNKQIEMIDLESGKKQNFTTGSDKRIRAVGFLSNDFIYGDERI